MAHPRVRLLVRRLIGDVPAHSSHRIAARNASDIA